MKHSELKTHKNEWAALYMDGMSFDKIAAKYKCSRNAVITHLKKIGVHTPNPFVASTHDTYLKKISKNESNGCWEWIGGRNNKGYGQFRIFGKLELAHRYSYKYFVGEIPAATQVLHKCDNPKCSNPSHLFLGTIKDNCIDMVVKGRKPGLKLNPDKVRDIRTKYSAGIKTGELSRIYNASTSTIKKVLNGVNWSHVK